MSASLLRWWLRRQMVDAIPAPAVSLPPPDEPPVAGQRVLGLLESDPEPES